MTTNTGGPAFPSKKRTQRAGYATQEFEPVDGMTLRDYFAGQAIIAYHADGTFSDSEDVANWCYRIADAMLEARKTK
jgi:hypothetical protein